MPSFLAGQKLTATLLNQIGTYTTFWANLPMFRMYQTATQSLANTSFVQVTMDTVDYDTDSGRAGTSPYSYTIPVGMTGRWAFKVTVAFAANATGSREAHIYRNGSQVRPVSEAEQNTGSNIVTASVSATLTVNAGDVMSAIGYQSSGGALSTYADAVVASAFEGRLISLANP